VRLHKSGQSTPMWEGRGVPESERVHKSRNKVGGYERLKISGSRESSLQTQDQDKIEVYGDGANFLLREKGCAGRWHGQWKRAMYFDV